MTWVSLITWWFKQRLYFHINSSTLYILTTSLLEHPQLLNYSSELSTAYTTVYPQTHKPCKMKLTSVSYVSAAVFAAGANAGTLPISVRDALAAVSLKPMVQFMTLLGSFDSCCVWIHLAPKYNNTIYWHAIFPVARLHSKSRSLWLRHYRRGL